MHTESHMKLKDHVPFRNHWVSIWISICRIRNLKTTAQAQLETTGTLQLVYKTWMQSASCGVPHFFIEYKYLNSKINAGSWHNDDADDDTEKLTRRWFPQSGPVIWALVNGFGFHCERSGLSQIDQHTCQLWLNANICLLLHVKWLLLWNLNFDSVFCKIWLLK